jgi:hypothetical protein
MFLTKKVKRLFRKELSVSRCETDWMVVTDSQSSLSSHGGHKVRTPVDLSLFEYILIQLGVIR